MQVSVFYPANNILGEGPLWHPDEQVLYWVDIVDQQVNRLEIMNQALESFAMPSRPGALAVCAKRGVFVALEQGLAWLNPLTGEITLGAQPLKDRRDVRFNDGKCDCAGRFWVGSLDLQEQRPLGELYCFDGLHTARKQAHGFTVSNGLGWSIDNRIMYFTDSAARKIYQYDYDIETGNIAHRRDFITLSPEEGYPDGMCVDSEGYLWVCHWDGWRITRFTPAGEIDRVIAMPVQRPTSCCFGGPGLNMLFITSARRDLSAEALAQTPDAGSVFVIETDYKGLPEARARFSQ